MTDAIQFSHRINMDHMEYVADKGPLIGWQLNEKDQCLESFSTLRMIGLKMGFASVSGVQGHYIVNTSGQTDEEPETQLLAAPCLAHFIDEASPPVFTLMFKWVYAAGKMYALTIPTDLKLSGGPDGTDKWVTPAMIKPVRLGLIHHFEPIENRDGQPLAKNLDVWIKDHFPEFAAIKLKSLANCRAWLQPSKFASHVAAVADLHEITIKKAIAAATGSDEPAAANKKGAANAHTVAAASAESARVAALSLSLPLLNRIREVWAIAAAVIAVPIGQRIIEIDLASELVDGVLSTDKLEVILKSKAAAKNYEKLFELLKASDKIALLASQKEPLGFSASPLQLLPLPEEPPPVDRAEVEPEVEGASTIPKTTGAGVGGDEGHF